MANIRSIDDESPIRSIDDIDNDQYELSKQLEKQQKIANFNYITGANRGPIDTLRDITSGVLTGLGKGGQFIASTLSGGKAPTVDMDKLFSNIASPNQSLEGNIAKGIASYIPYGIAGGPSILGQILAGSGYGTSTTQPTERNLFGVLPNGRLGGAIEGGLTGALGSGIAKVFSKVNPIDVILSSENKLSKPIINSHDSLEKEATEGFDKVSSEFKNRNLPNVNVDPEFIQGLQKYLPKIDESKSLINKASMGDYDSLRKLQADLYTKAKKNIRSPMEVDRDRGFEMFENRNKINQLISNHLKDLGEYDLSELLDKSRMNYRILQDVYYNPKLNKSIVKMVDPELRKIPKNLANVLSENSIPMQQLKDYHEGLEQSLKDYLLKQKLKSGLGKYGIPGAGAALGSYEALKYLKRNND